MRSVMIASLPRSMSTLVFRLTAKMLEASHKTPDTADGNPFGVPDELFLCDTRRYVSYFTALHSYRDTPSVIKVAGQPRLAFVYSYVHPEAYHSIYLDRPVADIVLSHYLRIKSGARSFQAILKVIDLNPNRVFSNDTDLLIQLTRAVLVCRRNWLERLPNRIDYDDLIVSPKSLWFTLEKFRLCPKQVNWSEIAPDFEPVRDNRLRRRDGALWKEIEGMGKELENYVSLSEPCDG